MQLSSMYLELCEIADCWPGDPSNKRDEETADQISGGKTHDGVRLHLLSPTQVTLRNFFGLNVDQENVREASARMWEHRTMMLCESFGSPDITLS